MKTLYFQISDEAYDLLMKIEREGYAEYRDTQHQTLEEFKVSDNYLVHNRTEDWFLARNFDGTYQHIPELHDMGLIKFDDLSWHDTYVLSMIGKVVSKNG